MIELNISRNLIEQLEKDNFGVPSKICFRKSDKSNDFGEPSGVNLKDTSDCLSTSTNDSLPCPPGAFA
jgi:hypothetical protein